MTTKANTKQKPVARKAKPKAQPNWPVIELDWRAGIKSASLIGREHNISHTAVRKHCTKLGIERDLNARIKAKADKLVSAALVAEAVSADPASLEAEDRVVEVNAQKMADVQIGQRKTIESYSKLAQKLLSEIEAFTDNPELFERLGELMIDSPTDDMSKGERDRLFKLQQAFEKVLSSPGRVDSFRKLVDTLKTLVGLERQAYGLADNGNGEANKPPVDTPPTDDDTVRRLAFLLTRNLKQREGNT